MRNVLVLAVLPLASGLQAAVLNKLKRSSRRLIQSDDRNAMDDNKKMYVRYRRQGQNDLALKELKNYQRCLYHEYIDADSPSWNTEQDLQQTLDIWKHEMLILNNMLTELKAKTTKEADCSSEQLRERFKREWQRDVLQQLLRDHARGELFKYINNPKDRYFAYAKQGRFNEQHCQSARLQYIADATENRPCSGTEFQEMGTFFKINGFSQSIPWPSFEKRALLLYSYDQEAFLELLEKRLRYDARPVATE